MLKNMAAEAFDEPVQRFFGELDISEEPSTFEVNGRRVYVVVRPAHEPTDPVTKWTEDQSKRRHHLIDLKLNRAISAVELLELARLNEEFDQHLKRATPLPMSYALEMLEKLTAPANGQP